MAKRTKKLSKSVLKLEALEQRQLLAGISGSGQEVTPGGEGVDNYILHPNGNKYDQVLMTGQTVSVTNDTGTVTRVSFMDLQGDIVQAEFSGKGTLTISLDDYSGPKEAEKYIQPGVKYVSGLATFTIEGSDSTTNFSVFSVGSKTAVNQSLFDDTHVGGNHTADVQRITVVADTTNPNGSNFGGIRAGNAVFTGSTGPVGITAANIQVQNTVVLGEINATDAGIPTLIFGDQSQFGNVIVAGGGLISENGKAINNTNSYGFGVTFQDGQKSDGSIDAKETTTPTWMGSDPTAPISKTLTTGVDTIVGSGGADVITGQIGSGADTLTALDSIDGGAGNDTLVVNDVGGGTGLPGGITLKNVETITLASAGAATIDTSSFTDVTSLKVVQGTSATATAADTTAVTVAGVSGAVTVDGGSTVAVTTSAGAVTIGGTTAPVDAVTVNHTKQGTNAIAVDGGTSVNVTAAGVGTGTVTVGAATQPTGAVTLSSTGVASTALTANTTLGAIAVNGGSTISVTQSAASATSGAAADTSNYTVTQSAVTVTGSDDTTSVTVAQDAAVTAANGVAAVAGTKETNLITFAALTAGQTAVVAGLTFTASKDLTANEVAAAFAGLSSGATQGSAASSNGVYSGTLGTWVSGTAASGKVTFTASAVGNVVDLAVAGTAAPTITTKTDGTAATTAVTGKMGVVGGAVTITDGGTGADSIASVSLTGYGAGSSITSDALTSLTLAKSNAGLTVTNGSATTLGLTVDGVGTSAAHAVIDDANGTYTTVNVTANGSNSVLDLDAVAVKTLTVAGSKSVDLTGATLDALETITVSGSAGLTIDGDQADTLKSIDASGTSGSVTAVIDPTKATYAGGTGSDAVTLTAAAPSKSINLGAGNDTLTLAAGTTSSVSELIGGDGIDTLVIAAADAQTASATAAFETKITGFEKLSLGQVAAGVTNTVDLDNLDEISYVISAGVNNATSVLNIDNMAANGTLELTSASNAAGTIDVDLKDATGTSDNLNVVVTNGNGIEAGTLNVAGVETIALTVTDTTTNAIGTHSMTLAANDLKTLTVTGNAGLNLTLAGATDSLTLLDGSAMTAGLTATGSGAVAVEIRGGSGADSLTAAFQGDKLVGNGGSDTLNVNGKSLVTLTGGAGADLFQVGTGAATTNVNSYATITDLEAGDKIQFSAGSSDFIAAAITLDASTAVFQDYANTAINDSSAGDVAWFQFNGNTYIVENVSGGSSFTNGTDYIVKLSGLKDLSSGSFSASADTLLIV